MDYDSIFGPPKKKTVETRLKDVESEISSIREAVKAQKASEELPVGTVIEGARGTLAIRVSRIHEYATDLQRKQTTSAVWVTVYNDFSGSSYNTLEDLQSSSSSQFSTYKVLRKGGF